MKAYLGDEKVVVVPDGVVQIGGTLSEAEKNWPSRLYAAMRERKSKSDLYNVRPSRVLWKVFEDVRKDSF